jgi:hypothetical protein
MQTHIITAICKKYLHEEFCINGTSVCNEHVSVNIFEQILLRVIKITRIPIIYHVIIMIVFI